MKRNIKLFIMDEIILINNLVWCSKQIDPFLKDFYPHFIIIP